MSAIMKLLAKISYYLNKMSDFTDRMLGSVCIIIYAFMVIIVFIGTVCRYVFAYSISFTEELATMLMISMIFLSVSMPFKREEHPRLTLIVEKFPGRVQKIVHILSMFLCIYVLSRLIPHAVNMIWSLGKGQRLTSLPISMALFYIPLGLGFSILLFEFVNLTLKKIVEMRSGPS